METAPLALLQGVGIVRVCVCLCVCTRVCVRVFIHALVPLASIVL